MSTATSINAKTLPDHELFFGHKACAGCGGSIAVRLALKVLGPRTFAVVPANCMSAVATAVLPTQPVPKTVCSVTGVSSPTRSTPSRRD